MASPKHCFQNFEGLKKEFDFEAAAAAADAAIGAAVEDAALHAEAELLRSRVAELEGEVTDLRLSLEAATSEAREDGEEGDGGLCRLNSELRTLRVTCAELQAELQQERQEVAAQTARAQVLREAVEKDAGTRRKSQVDAGVAAATMAAGVVEQLKSHLQAARDQLHSQGELFQAKQEELETANAHLQAQGSRMAHLDQRVQQLEGDQKLGSAAGKLDCASELAASGGKVLEGGKSETAQRRQAERQLDRFKKATRKYVQDFREGVFGLLGWRIEMKGEGREMRWHLTSRFHSQELVFQMRQDKEDKGFDLLDTQWADELQQNREIGAWLQVYDSIPAFLGEVTKELVVQQTL